LIAPS
jgi:hypothetical protein